MLPKVQYKKSLKKFILPEDAYSLALKNGWSQEIEDIIIPNANWFIIRQFCANVPGANIINFINYEVDYWKDSEVDHLKYSSIIIYTKYLINDVINGVNCERMIDALEKSKLNISDKNELIIYANRILAKRVLE